MKRRLFLSASLTLSLAACASSGGNQYSAGDQAGIARVEAYLNSLSSLRLLFRQTWPDGSTGDGAMSFSPGRFRLDYTRPAGMTLVAADGHVVLTDPRTGAVTRMGLSHTPLGLLLERPLRLSGPVTVTSVRKGAGFLQLSLARTARMSDGLLTLRFSDVAGALALSGIILVDDRQHVITLDITGPAD